MDGKYVLTGGEDDLVQVWSMEDRKVVAWGKGHNSWDTQLLLWDIEMDEIVVPLRRAPGGSPTYSTGNQSAHWDSACPVGTLQTAPSTQDVPKLSPLVAHRVHFEPLSGLVFTQESVLTVCREGHIKIWMRPRFSENQSNSSDSALSTSLKEKSLLSGKVGSSSYKP